jgi:hypothetical protein
MQGLQMLLCASMMRVKQRHPHAGGVQKKGKGELGMPV